MPAIYAHEKFGALVRKQLPPEEQAIINRYPQAFRIGLQGPDFMFFYRAFKGNKIIRKGHFYHHRDAYLFMKKAQRIIRHYGKDSSQYSYLLGFICHFSLDTICHPYVAQAMEQTGCSHGEVEGCFDQLLLIKDGYKPQKYKLAKLVPKDRETVKAMKAFYPDLSEKKIRKSLVWMCYIKRMLYAPGILKRGLLRMLMIITGNYKKYKGHIMSPRLNRKCKEEAGHLYRLLKQAVPVSIALVGNFSNACEGKKLSPIFHKDFYGKNMI